MSTRKRASGPLNAVTHAIDRIAEAARTTPSDGSHVNLARRTNIKVAKNVGRKEGTAHASATQTAPITQDGREQPT